MESVPNPLTVGLDSADVEARNVSPDAALVPTGGPLLSGLELLKDVPLKVTVELGRARMSVRDVLGVRNGSIVELDRPAGAPVDILVNGVLIARGEVVVVDERFGVRVTEIVAPVPVG